MNPRRTGWLAIVAAVLLLVGCTHRDNKDYAEMNKVPLQSVCVGRMLIGLPKGGKVDWQQQFDLARVSRLPYSINTANAFWYTVAGRKAKLEMKTKVHPNGNLRTYEKIGDNAVVFQFQDPELPSNPDLTPNVYFTERYLWLGDWGYKYETGELFANDASGLLGLIKGTFSQVHPINNYRPVTEPGFCIDGARVAGKIGPIWSAATATITGWKDVVVDVSARENDGSRPKPSWERNAHAPAVRTEFQELDGIKEWAAASARSGNNDRVVSFDVLRRRDRPLAGMDGQEIAVKAKLADGQEWYRFEWNSLGDDQRPNKSGFSATLEAGDQQYTSNYSAPPPQEDLLALWDAMLDSLKPRPGAGR